MMRIERGLLRSCAPRRIISSTDAGLSTDLAGGDLSPAPPIPPEAPEQWRSEDAAANRIRLAAERQAIILALRRQADAASDSIRVRRNRGRGLLERPPIQTLRASSAPCFVIPTAGATGEKAWRARSAGAFSIPPAVRGWRRSDRRGSRARRSVTRARDPRPPSPQTMRHHSRKQTTEGSRAMKRSTDRRRRSRSSKGACRGRSLESQRCRRSVGAAAAGGGAASGGARSSQRRWSQRISHCRSMRRRRRAALRRRRRGRADPQWTDRFVRATVQKKGAQGVAGLVGRPARSPRCAARRRRHCAAPRR